MKLFKVFLFNIFIYLFILIYFIKLKSNYCSNLFNFNKMLKKFKTATFADYKISELVKIKPFFYLAPSIKDP
jgi:hypothetical protein